MLRQWGPECGVMFNSRCGATGRVELAELLCFQAPYDVIDQLVVPDAMAARWLGR